MIRSTVTAHLAESDRSELTLQLNDRDIGVLAAQEQRHYVMSGNRRVQLIAGLQTDPEDQASVMSTRALLRHWLLAFRELQINGLNRLPAIAERNRLTADFLLLMDADLVLVWCPPRYGVYLHRGRHLYRQQPTQPPGVEGLAAFGRQLDFYAFRPREGDDLLIIEPSFIDLFDAMDLEALLEDIRQINVAMTELTRLAYSYGRNADTTWFSVQIQRIEADLELLSAESRERVAGRRQGKLPMPWHGRLERSKAVPLVDGNIRLSPPGLERDGREHLTGSRRQVHKPPQFTAVWRTGREEMERVVIKERPLRQEEPAGGPAARYDRRFGLLDRIKGWNTEGIRKSLRRIHDRLTHLVPESRGLSWLAYTALWLVFLVVLVAAVIGLRGNGNKQGPAEEKPRVTTQSTVTQSLKTEFEIDLIIRASGLRVVSAPGGDELVATVTRGDRVTQLKEPRDGWVLIRLADGRTGYVPETLLLAPEEGD